MARHPYLHRHLSVPTLKRTNTPIEINLIPPPLSTRNSRAQLTPLAEGTAADVLIQHPVPLLITKTRKAISPPVQDLSDAESEEEEKALYKCTLCHDYLPLDSKPYTLPATLVNSLSKSSTLRESAASASNAADSRKSNGSGRVFCRDCYVWIYDLGICWTCGEVVGRSEERVGFGWCWWHWGCYGCLICRVSPSEIRTYIMREKMLKRTSQTDYTWNRRL